MNKTGVMIGGIIIIVLAIAVYALSMGTTQNTLTNATTTPVTQTDTSTPAPIDTVATADPEDLPGSTPIATTNTSYAPTEITAVVTGTVNPSGAVTTYWYEYGVGTSLGKSSSKQAIGSGRVAIPAPGYITGLSKATTYYYKLVAENQYGKSAGEQQTLRTSATSVPPVSGKVPTAKTFPASAITQTTASLRGEVNPNAGTTQYWFEYGRTNSLGNMTPFISLGNGNTSIVATTELQLRANTTYFYRVNAQNEFGTVIGQTLSFKTLK